MNIYWQHWWYRTSRQLLWRSHVLAVTGLAALLLLHPASWLTIAATITATLGQYMIIRISGAPAEGEHPGNAWLLNFMLITVLHGALWGINILPLTHSGSIMVVMTATATWALSPYPPAAISFITAMLLPLLTLSGLGLVSTGLHQLAPIAIFMSSMLYILGSFCYQLQQDADDNSQELKKLDDINRSLYVKNEQSSQKAKELTELTMSDPLTGIANRRRLDEFIDREWSRGRRNQTYLAVIYLDIDNFKQYNDSAGHAAGDQALVAVAKTLKAVGRRGGDLAARHGGEEFMMVMAETNLEQASVVAERIRHGVCELNIHHPDNQPHGKLTVSIGLASIIPNDSTTMEQLVERADRALYKAKKHGKNCVVQG